jgi:hypothetical protein
MPPKPTAKKAGSKRAWIIIAVVGLAVVAYLYYKSSSASATQNQLPVTDASGATIPATDNSGATDTSGTDQASADLLGALAGENQQLMQSFLASEQGLVSLAGSSVGAFTSSQTAGEPAGSAFASTTSTPIAAPAAAPATTTSSSSPDLSSSPFYAAAETVASTITDSTGPSVVSEPTSGDVTYTPAGAGQPVSTNEPIVTQIYNPSAPISFSPAPAPKSSKPVSGYSQKSTASQLH